MPSSNQTVRASRSPRIGDNEEMNARNDAGPRPHRTSKIEVAAVFAVLLAGLAVVLGSLHVVGGGSLPLPFGTPDAPSATTSTVDGTLALPSSVTEPSGEPIRVEVFSADGTSLVDAMLEPAGLDSDGILAPPPGIAGWYSEPGWARPGWPGAAIIAGHVRNGSRADVFFDLVDATVGDHVIVSYDSGDRSVFRVTRSAAMHKNEVPQDDSIWDHASPTPLLRLITCDPATPTRDDGHLEGNWVIWADLGA